jgi:hypothetical protein
MAKLASLCSTTVAAVLGLSGSLAQANLLTFESGVLSGVEQPVLFQSYVEDSFTLLTQEFFIAPPTAPNPATTGLPNVSTRLFVSSHHVTMSANNNSLFSAQHVDLGSFFGINPLQAFVTFNGVRDDGSTVSQTFAAGAFVPFSVSSPTEAHVQGNFSTSTMDTYLFNPEFANLRSLSWDAVAADTPGARSYYVDNLAVTPVPEPGTWALMAAGLLGVVWMQGRRRRPLARAAAF